jgi:hypothetical protein
MLYVLATFIVILSGTMALFAGFMGLLFIVSRRRDAKTAARSGSRH